MKNKFFYPALFHKAEEGGFWVSFPDLPECLTQGENMEDAYEMSVEALGLTLESRIKENDVPFATELDQIACEPDSFPVIISFDFHEYLKRNNSKSVKKTLTIPEWLNEEATRKGINFSQVLQEALKQKLNIPTR